MQPHFTYGAESQPLCSCRNRGNERPGVFTDRNSFKNDSSSIRLVVVCSKAESVSRGSFTVAPADQGGAGDREAVREPAKRRPWRSLWSSSCAST